MGTLLLLLCALTQADPTVRYKDLPEIAGSLAGDVEKQDGAIVIWVVDNAPSLKQLGRPLAAALRKSFSKASTRHAVLALSETPRLVLKLTEGTEAAARAVEALSDSPSDPAIKNVLLAVREAARLAAGVSGRSAKYVVLFTQDNADTEDDLEGTVRSLKTSKITFVAIAPEAVYSDPYWSSAMSGSTYVSDVEKLKKLPFELKGPDSAFIEFPYGWPFVRTDAATMVPSGFATYALTRLAAETGGHSFLYAPQPSPFTFCQSFGCTLCAGQHQACAAVYDETKVSLTGPDFGSRAQYVARYGKEPLYGAVVTAWDRLYRAGILSGLPQLRVNGASLSVNADKRRSEPQMPFGGTEWRSLRPAALKLAEQTARALGDLDPVLRKADKSTDRRTLATAEALDTHLRLLEQSYHQVIAFCDEMERIERGGFVEGGFASSRWTPGPGERVIGYTYKPVYLCHGGGALKAVAFLGDRTKLHAALDQADLRIDKHRGTPWEVLLRRGSVAVFVPLIETEAMRAARAAASRERPTSGSTARTDETPGTPQRPPRPARGGDGSQGGGGTTTGGQR